ncbi:MAG: cyclic nucleotide-binding domain-containing protein, partial [Acidimicrobiales bacterium]
MNGADAADGGELDGYGLELIAFLDDTPTARMLEPGEHLIEQHEEGSEVFVVLDGRLEAIVGDGEEQATVGHFQRGQLFGELTAISGGPRTATVHSPGHSSVAVIARNDFMRWLEANPGLEELVARRARARVDRNRAAAMLALVLGTDNQDVLEQVLPLVEFRTLGPAEVLCAEGDPSDSAYLILSGRVAVISDQNVGTGRTVELGRNQIVGELGVLDRLPRTATVTAMRQTTLAELPAHAVDLILERHPEVGLS